MTSSNQKGIALTVVIIFGLMTALIIGYALRLTYNQLRLARAVNIADSKIYYLAKAGVVDAAWRIRVNAAAPGGWLSGSNFTTGTSDPKPYFINIDNNTASATETVGVSDIRVDISSVDATTGLRTIVSRGLDSSSTAIEAIRDATYYPSPYGSYEQVRVQNQDESATLTDFTQSLTRAGINIITEDIGNGADAYTSGIFWSTLVNYPTKPKAGIWSRETAAGTRLLFDTSGDYAVGLHAVPSMVLDENGRVGLGTETPREQLELTGNLRLPPTTDTPGTAGFLLAGPDRFLHQLRGQSHTFLGIRSGSFNTFTDHKQTGVGYQALQNVVVADGNTALGSMALLSNQDGEGNTALGWSALTEEDNSTYKTAVGSEAFFKKAGNGFGLAFGHQASHNDSTATGTVVGAYAQHLFGGHNNIAIGFRSLYKSKTTHDNVALGAEALENNITSTDPIVAVGAGAGQNATGDGNVFLGYQAGQNETGSNKLYIDNSNTAGPLILGDFTNDTIKINGFLGIGRDPEVVPGVGTYRLTLPNTSNEGGWGRANAWKNYSSIRWKENIAPIPSAFEKALKLRGVTYTHKESKRQEIGMIAEEVGQVFPEVVDYEENGTDAIGMSYDRLVAVLVEAVKELKVENEALQKEIGALEKK